jgi:transposase-like protein
MFVPEKIEATFKALRLEEDPLVNLRSIKTLRDWLGDMEIRCIEFAHESGSTFQQIAEVQERPRQAVHRTLRDARTSGLTDPDFDGVSSSTLRYWLDWWSDPSRTSQGVEEDGHDPATEAAKVRAELDARFDAGLLRKAV